MVCKPDGEIIIVNHFESPNLIVKAAEAMVRPFSRFASFETDFNLDEFLAKTQLDVIEMRQTNLFGFATVLRCRNSVKSSNWTDEATTPAGDWQAAANDQEANAQVITSTLRTSSEVARSDRRSRM